MRLNITDKFLWDTYSFLSDAGDILSSGFKYPTMRNSLPGVENPIFKKYRKEKGAKRFSRLIYYLKIKGYIRIDSLSGNQTTMLTKEGIDKALKSSFKFEKQKKRRDGKWTMIIFDIPQKFRRSRELLRSILINLGFKMFQQSVWISPYDNIEKAEKLIAMHSLDKFVKIFLIEQI